MPDLDPSEARGAAALGGLGAESETPLLNLAWTERFVEALAGAGVRDACICSGSRSAPLALAFDQSPIRTHVPLDERAGGYFALGLAKASRRPVAIITTSGTAAANLHPAVIEAFHGRVPLLVLTADRPPELRDTGAAQTIDQIKLFGSAVRWFHEVGAPTPDPQALRYVAALGSRAAREAWGPPAGPVHLNFAFREPLVPEPEAVATRRRPNGPERQTRAADLEEVAPAQAPPEERALARMARILRARRRGLLICGPEDPSAGAGQGDFSAAIARLAAVTGYPVLADPASELRFGSHDRDHVFGAYDAFLRAPAFAEGNPPEVVLQFGAPLTSKAYHLYAARHPGTLHYLVDPGGEWRDPARRASDLFRADPTLFARALAGALAKGADPLPGWMESFARAERAATDTLAARRAEQATISEGPLQGDLLEMCPEGTIVYAGNSMVIRDLDGFANGSPKRIRVLANRGANGIDGIVSSGLGASAAGADPVLIITGDLSFHHDLNGLAALRDHAIRATIVIVNNDGGGIFSFLPIARHGETFERYFGTPHGLDFEPAASLYGVPYFSSSSREEIRSRVARSLRERENLLVEVRCERAANRAAHEAAWAAVRRAVETSLP